MLVLPYLKGINYTFDISTVSSLIEKFYGRPGESTLGKMINRGGSFSNRSKYGVKYNATRFFINKEAAEEFYRNIAGDASLIKRNEASDELIVYKSK